MLNEVDAHDLGRTNISQRVENLLGIIFTGYIITLFCGLLAVLGRTYNAVQTVVEGLFVACITGGLFIAACSMFLCGLLSRSCTNIGGRVHGGHRERCAMEGLRDDGHTRTVNLPTPAPIIYPEFRLELDIRSSRKKGVSLKKCVDRSTQAP